jgi:hypothetical protein
MAAQLSFAFAPQETYPFPDVPNAEGAAQVTAGVVVAATLLMLLTQKL